MMRLVVGYRETIFGYVEKVGFGWITPFQISNVPFMVKGISYMRLRLRSGWGETRQLDLILIFTLSCFRFVVLFQVKLGGLSRVLGVLIFFVL